MPRPSVSRRSDADTYILSRHVGHLQSWRVLKPNKPGYALLPSSDEEEETLLERRITLMGQLLGHFRWLLQFLSEQKYSEQYCRDAKEFRATALTFIDQLAGKGCSRGWRERPPTILGRQGV